MTHTELIRRHAERRQDNTTAERIDMALQTLRAFDEHTARRFLSIAGVPGDAGLQCAGPAARANPPRPPPVQRPA